MRLAVSLVMLAACGPHLKTEVIGTHAAAIVPRGAIPPAEVGGIALPVGTYDLAIAFEVPRAQVVDWTLACGGVTEHGQLGETFDAYRVHRLAELAADRDHARRQVAGVTNLLVGALAPRAEVHTTSATATVAVDPAAAGELVANVTIDPRVALPPNDVGAGRYTRTVRLETTTPGSCALTAATDDATVAGRLRVVRIRDLDAEARAARTAATARAITARATVTARLVAGGADLEARQRRIDAAIAIREARLDAEVAARVRVEAERAAQLAARAEIVARVHTQAVELRAVYATWLVGTCHADPQARARRIAARDAGDAALRAHTQATLKLHRHQAELALQLREQVRGQLVARGARLPERAAVPAIVVDDRAVVGNGGGVVVGGGVVGVELGRPVLPIVIVPVVPELPVVPVRVDVQRHAPGPRVRDHRHP